jgi:transcriptional regulator NrdR family protein
MMAKIEYRECEKCGQKYTTATHSKINLCYHCWKPEWRL